MTWAHTGTVFQQKKTRARRAAALLFITCTLASVQSFGADAANVPCPVRTDAMVVMTGKVVSSHRCPRLLLLSRTAVGNCA